MDTELKLALVRVTSERVKLGEKPTGKLYSCKGIYVKSLYSGSSLDCGDKYDNYVLCALVNVTKDFNPYGEQNPIYIYNDTDSFQIRPKLIYQDSNGIYYKPFGKVIRFSKTEEFFIKLFIEQNK